MPKVDDKAWCFVEPLHEHLDNKSESDDDEEEVEYPHFIARRRFAICNPQMRNMLEDVCNKDDDEVSTQLDSAASTPALESPVESDDEWTALTSPTGDGHITLHNLPSSLPLPVTFPFSRKLRI